MKKPLSYWLFKLRLEFHHIDTFGRDDKIKKEYEKYVKEFYEQKNGRYTDTKKEEDCDLSFDSWKDIQDALDNDDLEISICKLYK